MSVEELKELEEEKLGNISVGLSEYKNLYTKGLQLIKSEAMPKELLLNILDDYQERLDKIPAIDLSVTNLEQLDEHTKENVRSLILFGTQAALIKDNASARKKLQEANQNYRDLLSVVTHEFKNSLTSIYGYNRIVKKRIEEGSTDSILDINKQMDRLTRNLFGLVETLFSMSLLEQGKLEIDPKIFDIIEDSLKPVLAELELRLEQKTMSVKIDAEEFKNIYYGDERFFQLIFRNLIQNAIQYGYADTEIEINLKTLENNLQITVFNKGSGLPKKNLKKVFEKFSRFHTSKEKVNVGIGLFTVKRIIELHKGSIEAESEPSKWMKFIIRLPLEIDNKE